MAELQDSLHFLDYWRIIRSRKEVVLAVSLMVVGAGLLITYTMPKVYMASVVIKVKEDTPDVPLIPGEVVRFDPLFLRTQFEIIQSNPIIEEVVRQRELDRKLAAAYGFQHLPPEKALARASRILSRNMKVQQFRDTNLIEIRVYLSEPKDSVTIEAAETANMIARIFRDQNTKRNRETTERALKAIYEAWTEQTNRVTEAEAKVEEIRQKHKIDLIGSMVGTETSLPKLSLAQLEGSRIKARVDVAGKEVKYKTIESLAPDKLRDSASYIVEDEELRRLVAQKRTKEVELKSLLETRGPKHPEVVSMESVVKELDRKIEDALNGLKVGVKTDYEAAKATLDVIDAELERMRAVERNRESLGYREFNAAIQETEHAKKIRDTIEMRYLAQRIEQRIPRTSVEVISPAKPPDRNDPVSPDLLLNIILSIVIGLGSGIGLAYFIEYLDVSVKTIEDIERIMGVPVLGVIPQKVKPLFDEAADPGHAEAYRVMRTNIQFSKRLRGGKTFCVTSGSVGEGKSLTICNLAYICAELGDRVLVVDTDMHRPKQHRLLGVSNNVGLANVLVGDVAIENAILATRFTNFDLLTSGKLSSDVHGLLDTRRMKDLVKQMRESYDVVLFDSPPIIGVSDASLIVREVDGVLLVIQHRKYPKWVPVRAKNMVENLGATLVGVVLNNINISRDYSYYYYHQHYGYYPAQKQQREKKA